MLDSIGRIISTTIHAAMSIGIILGLFIYAPLMTIKEYFFKSVDPTTYYLVGGTVIGSLFFLYYVFDKTKRRFTKCQHGIRGGFTHGLCPQCISEKEESLRLEQERLRLEAIKKTAEEFRSNEIKKLKIKQNHKLDYLHTLSPLEFEDVIMDMFRKLGFKVTQTSLRMSMNI